MKAQQAHDDMVATFERALAHEITAIENGTFGEEVSPYSDRAYAYQRFNMACGSYLKALKSEALKEHDKIERAKDRKKYGDVSYANRSRTGHTNDNEERDSHILGEYLARR